MSNSVDGFHSLITDEFPSHLYFIEILRISLLRVPNCPCLIGSRTQGTGNHSRKFVYLRVVDYW